jgi:cobalt-zinc-cadmium efflux system protein
VRPGGLDAFLSSVRDGFSRRFNIAHATLQIEAGNDVCRLAPAEVIQNIVLMRLFAGMPK